MDKTNFGRKQLADQTCLILHHAASNLLPYCLTKAPYAAINSILRTLNTKAGIQLMSGREGALERWLENKLLAEMSASG